MGNKQITRGWEIMTTIICYLKGVVKWIFEFIASILEYVLEIFPPSPFSFELIPGYDSFFGYINYFIPFQGMLTVMGTYLVSVILYYGGMWLARMIRLLG